MQKPDLIDKGRLTLDLASLKAYVVHRLGMVVRVNDIATLIAAAPSVDAVPVVRCADCKNWNRWDGGWCKFLDGTTLGNDYCCWGERKEDDRERKG